MTTALKTLKDVSTEQMSKEDARTLTDQIRSNLDSLPVFIQKAMLGNAPKALGYDNVNSWAKAEFGLSRSRIYQFVHWQTVLLSLIETFDLDSEWSIIEEKTRHLNKERLLKLVDVVQEKLDTCESTTPEKRGDIVKEAIIFSYGDYLKAQAEKKASRAITVSANASNTDTDIPEEDEAGNRPTQPAVIIPVGTSYELLVVKAQDTASVLASLTVHEVADTASTLAKLTDARAVLEDLIAYFSTVELGETA